MIHLGESRAADYFGSGTTRSCFHPWLALFVAVFAFNVFAEEDASTTYAPLKVEQSAAKTEKEMKPYDELIEHTEVKISMLPIKGGEFMMGSPASEADRGDDETPHKVRVEPFWMAKCEITWDAYECWMFDLDVQRRKAFETKANARDKAADEYQLSQPTKPYLPMDFGMGRKGLSLIHI